MRINMTSEQKVIFNKGAEWGKSQLVSYVEKHHNELETDEEKIQNFILDILGTIEDYLSGNLFEYYAEMEKAEYALKIPQDMEYLFELGVREHYEYMKFCIQTNNSMSILYMDIKNYLFGLIPNISNKYYPSFNKYVEA